MCKAAQTPTIARLRYQSTKVMPIGAGVLHGYHRIVIEAENTDKRVEWEWQETDLEAPRLLYQLNDVDGGLVLDSFLARHHVMDDHIRHETAPATREPSDGSRDNDLREALGSAGNPDADTVHKEPFKSGRELTRFIRASIREVKSLSPEWQYIVSDILGTALQRGASFMTMIMVFANLAFLRMKNMNRHTAVK
ncbi:hypothetical protein BX666DRAFT_2027512 [Dichotomocladium elegans]|nr:hypothetical protein BX666DRAFT_2027512 [Dichotomocladium elegans]